MKEQIREKLINLSHWVGNPEKTYAMLGEGNTSAKIDDKTFFVKASGANLGSITADYLVEVDAAPVLEMIDGPLLPDLEIKARLASSTLNNPLKRVPSVETLMHAYLLTLPEVNFVGHCHPVWVNCIMCSKKWKELTSGNLYPEHIVCCGPAPVHVPYTDPGVAMAREIKDQVEAYIKKYGTTPLSILIQNHGLVAFGKTPAQVETIIATWEKSAQIIVGAQSIGGVNFLTAEETDRIVTRPDEANRIEMLYKTGV